MSAVVCAVTEILVAVGDSYWRCVSCQLQYSRHVSIDEHITLKHGGSQLHSHSLVSEPHTGISHLPNSSSYQPFSPKTSILSHNVGTLADAHLPHITSCVIPEVVKINLDVDKMAKSDNGSYNSCITSHHIGIHELHSNENTEGLDFPYHLTNNESNNCQISKSINSTNHHSGTEGREAVMNSSIVSESILCENVSESKQTSEIDSNYDEEEGVDKGNRCLLNSMLSLLEKSMDMDDINGVIQNWDALNPELFEQQLLSNNSELSPPHSLSPECGSLDPVEHPLNSAEELLNTAVESINSQAEFLSASDEVLHSSVSERSNMTNTTANNTGDNVTQPEIEQKRINCDVSETSMSHRQSSCEVYHTSKDHADNSGMENDSKNEGKVDKEDDSDEENEMAENIIECLKSYLKFSTSNCKLFSINIKSHINKDADCSEKCPVMSNKNLNSTCEHSGNLDVCKLFVSCTGNATRDASNDISFTDNLISKENTLTEDKIIPDDLRISSLAASNFAKLCLSQENHGLQRVPRLFIASSRVPISRMKEPNVWRKPFYLGEISSYDSHLYKRTHLPTEGSDQAFSLNNNPVHLHNLQPNFDTVNHTDLGENREFREFANGCDSSVKQHKKNDCEIMDSKASVMSVKDNGQFPINVVHCRLMPLVGENKTPSKSILSSACSIAAESAMQEHAKSKLSTNSQSRLGKHKHRSSNASLSMQQIKKLKSDVLAIMKSQRKASKADRELSSSMDIPSGGSSLPNKKAKMDEVNAEKKPQVEKLAKITSKVKEKETDEKWKTCLVCDRRFSTNGALQRHLKLNENSTDACKCKACDKKFHCLSQLNVHIYKYHEVKGKPTCFRCNTKFSSIRCLAQHVQKYQKPIDTETSELQPSTSPSKGKAWRCSSCGLVCLNQPKIIAGHKCKIRLKKCSKCDKKFPTCSALNIHMAAHLGSMYECDLCGQLFKNKLSRHHHKLTHESVQGEFLCQVCGQQFQFQHKLTAHIKIHSKKKSPQPIYKCGDCGRHYKNKKCLKRHVDVVHKGIKDYQYKCEQCQQQFFSSWQLRDHITWRHFGEKPYHCVYCGQGFVCHPTLVRHQRKEHTGVKPHKCRYCDEAFVEKVNLDTHEVKVHTGLFPYICSQCGKGFVHGSSFRTHQKLHTNSRPHQCHICGNGFTKTSHLKRHMVSCMKKNQAAAATETLPHDMEHVPSIPPTHPSNLSSFMLPLSGNALPFPATFLAQNF